ncbi:MAG: polysaccharide deacetylase family protein [Thermoleophilaceae bacterium]|nr:polysaccharide deacetylase family protein [Thermoleophilaceae bacterium]
MATSSAHTDVERPLIEVSTVPTAMALDIANSEAIYISPSEQKAAMKRIVKSKLPVFCAGTKKYAALSFDDGPSATTPQLVKLLKEEGIPATFFDLGKNAQADVPGLKLHAAYGPIGNHSWDHSDYTTLSTSDLKAQLNDTQEVFKTQVDQDNMFMRPPYGARNPATENTTRKLGYAEMLWSADSQDGLAKPWQTIAKNAIDGLGPGANILFHDGPTATIEALKRKIIPAIRKSGLTMVTLPELMVLNPPSDEQLKMGASGCSHAGRVNVSGVFMANPEGTYR